MADAKGAVGGSLVFEAVPREGEDEDEKGE